MNPGIELLLQILSFAGVPALIICGYNWIKKQVAENEAVEKGMRVLISDRITQIFYTSTEKGYCRMYVRKSVSSMFEQYKELGGNGHIEDLYNKIQALPTDPPQK